MGEFKGPGQWLRNAAEARKRYAEEHGGFEDDAPVDSGGPGQVAPVRDAGKSSSPPGPPVTG